MVLDCLTSVISLVVVIIGGVGVYSWREQYRLEKKFYYLEKIRLKTLSMMDLASHGVPSVKKLLSLFHEVSVDYNLLPYLKKSEQNNLQSRFQKLNDVCEQISEEIENDCFERDSENDAKKYYSAAEELNKCVSKLLS